MKQWRLFLLTVSFQFVVCNGEDIYWQQARMREDTEVAYQVVQRSALQRIFEINMVLQQRSGQKSVSNAQLAELYKKHLQQTASSEQITTHYISEAVKLYKNLLCDTEVRHGQSRVVALAPSSLCKLQSHPRVKRCDAGPWRSMAVCAHVFRKIRGWGPIVTTRGLHNAH